MSKVSLTGVIKRFGDMQVVHGIDLEIEEGDFCVFVGPSGCGKSTLLRMIAGLEETNVGEIRIGERNVTHADPAKRGVAMVFQTYALYPHMTVRDNMGFGLKMGGADKTEIGRKVSEAAQILRLDDYMDRKPKALSGGQRQRVAIGRAIVRNPEVFLFDEPLSNLDAELRVQMRLEIARLHKDLASTMIYVTHDQVEAMTMADKIVVLRDGRVEQYGSPVRLYEDPDNEFVAQFIGSPKMNMLAGEIATNGAGTHVRLPDFDNAVVPVNAAENLAAGTPVKLGIRPEHFEASGSIRLPVRISVVENLGGVRYAYAQTGRDAAPVTIEIREKSPPREGEVFQAAFDPENALLFDAQSGHRVR